MSLNLRQQLRDALGDQYTIDDELGDDGMSHTFRARDRVLYRDLLVKVLTPSLYEGISRERFAMEIRRAVALRSPHVAPLLVSGLTASGAPFYTIAFINGESLRERLQRGLMEPRDVVSMLRDVARALSHAHGHGIVHRNLKPENVIINDTMAVVTDIGVAQAAALACIPTDDATLSRILSRLGTPAYMSPEQVEDGDVTAQADIYAWGLLAYEALSGRHPFAGKAGAIDLMAAHRQDTPTHLGEIVTHVPRAFTNLVMQCLQKDPMQRPRGADTLLAMFAMGDAAKPASDHTIVARRSSRRTAVIATSVLLVAITASALLWLQPRGNADQPVAPAPVATAAAPRLAVLPFYQSGADTSDAFLLAGLTDDITAQLAHVPGLSVLPRTSTNSAFARASTDPVQLGNILGVEWVLEGRLVREAQRLAVSVSLTNVADGTSVLRRDFSEDASGIFALEDAISRAATAALKVTSVASAWPDPARDGGVEAHTALMRGRYDAGLGTAAGLRSAVALYEQAVGLNATYAQAWRELADCWLVLATDYMPAQDALKAGARAADRAWQLDSTSAMILAQRATRLFWYDRNFSAADSAFTRALLQDSTLARAPIYADLLLQTGRADSAAAVMEHASRVAPLSPFVARFGPRVLTGAARIVPLRRVCTQAVQLDSARFAADCMHSLLRVTGEWRAYGATCIVGDHLCKGVALFADGNKSEALGQSALFESSWRDRVDSSYVDAGLLATWHAQMGDVSRALKQLEAARQTNSAFLAYLRDPVYFASIKDDPQFVAFVKRVGLP